MKTDFSKKGFSLLELLAVMAVLAILSTLAVTGYFSAIRGMLKQRSATAVSNALVLARQRACTEAVNTAVVCFNVWSGGEQGKTGLEKWKACMPTYVVCKAIGQFTYVQSPGGAGLLGDEFAPLDRMFGISSSVDSNFTPLRLYNLTRGGWSDVSATVTREDYKNQPIEKFPATGANFSNDDERRVLLCFHAKAPVNMPGGWQVGDAYGVAVTPIAVLPKSIYFGSSSGGKGTAGSLHPDQDTSTSSRMMQFMFYPDGRAEPGRVELLSLEPDLTRFKTVEVLADGTVNINK
ncbi:MAG: prepilin-type N-terminal cleavage/methylation domain-containing protein [Kiritimatiellaeota bacterium]|nr:prepilin-type N-terminal cleavage/methylation domain-containing protein [Kiritimatiellota bacterium]